jgi:hypothetical protein
MIAPVASFLSIARVDLIVLGLLAVIYGGIVPVLVALVRFCTRNNPRLARPVGGLMMFVGGMPMVYSIVVFTSFGSQSAVLLGAVLPFTLLALILGIPIALAGIWLVLSPPRAKREPK